MDCKDCTLAQWRMTVNGKLHPSGDGACSWVKKVRTPPVDASDGIVELKGPSYINRHDYVVDRCPVGRKL